MMSLTTQRAPKVQLFSDNALSLSFWALVSTQLLLSLGRVANELASLRRGELMEQTAQIE